MHIGNTWYLFCNYSPRCCYAIGHMKLCFYFFFIFVQNHAHSDKACLLLPLEAGEGENPDISYAISDGKQRQLPENVQFDCLVFPSSGWISHVWSLVSFTGSFRIGPSFIVIIFYLCFIYLFRVIGKVQFFYCLLGD